MLSNNKDNSAIASKAVFELFKQYKDKPFIFVEPGGNHGDYLIYKGAQKLAHIAGIKYKTVTYREFMNSQYQQEAILYIHGSGGFVPFWAKTPQVCDKAITTHKGVVIIGPTTFFPDLTFLKETLLNYLCQKKAKKVIIFTRERTSFEALQKLECGDVDICLDHDTALNLHIDDILKGTIRKRYNLYALREDKEAPGISFWSPLIVRLDPVKSKLNFKEWIYLHARAKRIITNRLHSAILSSILNIPVMLTPNNYHKNRSVWEYSLSKRGVTWSDSIPINGTAAVLNNISPLKNVINSYICQRALKLYFGTGYRSLHSPRAEETVLA